MSQLSQAKTTSPGTALVCPGFCKILQLGEGRVRREIKNFALSPVVGSQRGVVSLNLQGHADGRGVLALAHRGSTAMAAD